MGLKAQLAIHEAVHDNRERGQRDVVQLEEPLELKRLWKTRNGGLCRNKHMNNDHRAVELLKQVPRVECSTTGRMAGVLVCRRVNGRAVNAIL